MSSLLSYIKETFNNVKAEKGGPDETYAMWREFFETLINKWSPQLVECPKILNFIVTHFAKIDDELDVLCSPTQIHIDNYESNFTPNGYLYDEIWNEDDRFEMAETLRNLKTAFIYSKIDFVQGFSGINRIICDFALEYY